MKYIVSLSGKKFPDPSQFRGKEAMEAAYQIVKAIRRGEQFLMNGVTLFFREGNVWEKDANGERIVTSRVG